MQLSLLGSFPFPAGCWAREARGINGVVIWISDPYEAAKHGLVRQLLNAGPKAGEQKRLDRVWRLI